MRNISLAGLFYPQLKCNFEAYLKAIKMNTQKLDSHIKNDLFATNTERVISAINRIKERGNKLYLPMLFELLASQPEAEVEKEIEKLLSTVKSKDTVPYFAEALENEKFKSIQKTLLTACWQNGLDFANYLPVFVEIVITGTWENAFEAFTVIDNLEHLPDPQIVDQTIDRIHLALKTANEQNQYFLREILVKIR